MKALDRMIKSERRYKYKLRRKARKARDAAKKYVKRQIKVKEVCRFYSRDFIQYNSVQVIAKDIVDRKGVLQRIRPPKPPAQNCTSYTKPTFTILPENPKPLVRKRTEKE